MWRQNTPWFSRIWLDVAYVLTSLVPFHCVYSNCIFTFYLLEVPGHFFNKLWEWMNANLMRLFFSEVHGVMNSIWSSAKFMSPFSQKYEIHFLNERILRQQLLRNTLWAFVFHSNMVFSTNLLGKKSKIQFVSLVSTSVCVHYNMTSQPSILNIRQWLRLFNFTRFTPSGTYSRFFLHDQINVNLASTLDWTDHDTTYVAGVTKNN